MFRRSVRSGLFIDYENIPQTKVRDGLAGLLNWLEDGRFDHEDHRRRRLVDRRVYWNYSSQHHEPAFLEHGFSIVTCEKHAGLKNAADIKLALDILETVLKPVQRIDEYIIVSSDTDFIPLLQRLNLHEKQSVMVVDQSKPSVYTAINYHADIIIPQRDFMASGAYVRPRRTWLGWLGGDRRPANGRTVAAGAAIGKPGTAAVASSVAEPTATGAMTQPGDPLLDAEKRVIQLISRQPNQPTAHKKIRHVLKRVKGLRWNPGKGEEDEAWLGFKSYEGLMQELAKRSERINLVKTSHGGYNVIYIPLDATD